MQDIKTKWEDWYGDMVSSYQWNEVDYNNKKVLYVFGCAKYTGDQGDIPAGFVQVMRYVDSELPIEGEAQREISNILKKMYRVETVSFWSD